MKRFAFSLAVLSLAVSTAWADVLPLPPTLPVNPPNSTAGAVSYLQRIRSVTFNTTTGFFSGTPAAGTAGVYTFNLTASSAGQPTATETYTLAVNGPPTMNAFTVPTLTEGVAMTPIVVSATGLPIPSLSATLPTGLFGVDNGNGTITISGTPAEGTAGASKTITITATNSFGTATKLSAAFNINGPPTFVNGGTDSAIGRVGEPVDTMTGTNPTAARVRVSGFPVPTLRCNNLSGTAIATGIAGVTFDTTTGTFSGTPATGTAGVYILYLTAINSAGSTLQTFTLTINPPNSTAGAASYSQQIRGLGTGTTWAVTAGSLPPGLNLNTMTGTISGSPTTVGVFPFTITTTNRANSIVQDLSITINPVPVITTTLPPGGAIEFSTIAIVVGIVGVVFGGLWVARRSRLRLEPQG
jgi:hypothetical protein